MKLRDKKSQAIGFAVLAAALYAINAPVSKLLLSKVSATMMAAFLYLGAGIGLSLLQIIQKGTHKEVKEKPLTRRELPYTIGMIVLDIAAPLFLMAGLTMTTAANASLLNNFEIVATSVIALAVFHEAISKRLWIAIGLVTVASLILSFEDISSLSFSMGSVFVLLACVCWGFENNCTRMLSEKSPIEIVIIKGFCSGMGSFVIALIMREPIPKLIYILGALLLGFVAYGLSIFFYIYAQRYLGAAKTSAYYAISPFIGVAVSFVIFRQTPTIWFLIALVIMMIGTYFASTDGEI
ncbi:DMT family transporter [Roseburia sp. MSJ-14]|uniref:DMT family transporter n=1 Tax=Roseburia sp. MSJ-14 TaxID=2841514 RepID=UPI001C101785|nr:DMT family transporter [Roseburia sp. MSJ-14]MBU5472293.1 DMT family transporter [Roseburia sp. MSJ-14]